MVYQDISVEHENIEKRQILEHKNLLQDYKTVMSSEAGVNVLISLSIDFCGAFEAGQANEFNQGMRHVGLSLLRQMSEADPDGALRVIGKGYIDGYRRSD